MKVQVASAAAVLLAGQALAAPAQLQARQGKTAAAIIAEIAPGSASCDGTPDCRTADQAAPFLIEAMAKYGLTSPGQIAGVLALSAFESVDFKFKHNVFPGRPGQGTSNMQMFPFNILYAQSISELAGQVSGVSADAPDAQKNEILDLLADDKYNFGSGAWFLTTQCGSDVVEGLKSGSDASFAAYMACVGVGLDGDRQAYWTRAKQAFGI
ncbi:hypothetical protein GGS23DRAFT_597377 [Durotheca rogersii]|uniref:uncharacterized protein n=1 Tax=Durotheca rogersii TaxID=419775 RepID=UPI002220B1A9|nr:uncharacterized protein GGS23DRAFT_597377 [Durotheca rogersii]KAI5862578.1 hypothetical protein GGS23DRAFT_597377 [Durotheca rogersii]